MTKRCKTQSWFLPSDAFIAYRDPAGMDSTMFLEWVDRFTEETQSLRKKFKYVVLTFDGYGAHISYKALRCLKENRIVTIGLLAHTCHRTQVLDITLFLSV